MGAKITVRTVRTVRFLTFHEWGGSISLLLSIIQYLFYYVGFQFVTIIQLPVLGSKHSDRQRQEQGDSSCVVLRFFCRKCGQNPRKMVCFGDKMPNKCQLSPQKNEMMVVAFCGDNGVYARWIMVRFSGRMLLLLTSFMA